MLKDGKTSFRITSPLLALLPLLLLSSSYLSSWYVIHPVVFCHRFIKIAHLFPLFFVIWLDITFPCETSTYITTTQFFHFFFSKISEFNCSQKFIPKSGIILYLNFLSIKISKVAYLHDLGPGVFFFLDEWKYIIKRTLSSGPHTTLL